MRLSRKRQPARTEPAPTIAVGDLRHRLERGQPPLVLDARQPAAYAAYPGAIPGSVRLPPAELPERYGELPRDRLIVVYCT